MLVLVLRVQYVVLSNMVNDENDSSSVSFQGLGPCAEAPPAAIVYSKQCSCLRKSSFKCLFIG